MTSKIRVLCIDDEADTLELLQLILERKGYEVVTALDGRDGLQAMGEEKPDIVLLDIMMPKPDGWQVFHTIKNNPAQAHIPVIMVTAKAQSIDQVLGLHVAKADGYVTKPFLPGELFRAMDTALAKAIPAPLGLNSGQHRPDEVGRTVGQIAR